MCHRRFLLALAAAAASGAAAFVPPLPQPIRSGTSSAAAFPSYGRTRRYMSDEAEEARALLEKVRKMREEIASLEGRSAEEVEREAADKREREKAREREVEEEREERAKARANGPRHRMSDGRFIEVPATFEQQVIQASDASSRAFRDGKTRQIVRFELMGEEDVLNEDRNWPGGAAQMYREGAGPLARALLSEVRAPTGEVDEVRTNYRPNVTSEDIWDFDGSALVTAEAATGSHDNVMAMVLPNTDNKYSNDIKSIDAEMGDRLFVLVNPFWRNLDSWGVNILAPRAKQIAKEAIFDRGFEETYCLLRTSVRGEDCVALKVYPYNWQLFAFIEQDAWPYEETTIRLGETEDEPTSAQFGELMEGRDEFKMNKNMRNLQRMRNRD